MERVPLIWKTKRAHRALWFRFTFTKVGAGASKKGLISISKCGKAFITTNQIKLGSSKHDKRHQKWEFATFVFRFLLTIRRAQQCVKMELVIHG